MRFRIAARSSTASTPFYSFAYFFLASHYNRSYGFRHGRIKLRLLEVCACTVGASFAVRALRCCAVRCGVCFIFPSQPRALSECDVYIICSFLPAFFPQLKA